MKTKPLTRTELENFGSLITIKGKRACLGDLLFFDGHGCYDPTYGRVPVEKAEADAHNAALDKARLDGMDKAEVGQCGGFYLVGDGRITTFIGTLVGSATVKGRVVTMERDGKTWRGTLERDGSYVVLKRVR